MPIYNLTLSLFLVGFASMATQSFAEQSKWQRTTTFVTTYSKQLIIGSMATLGLSFLWYQKPEIITTTLDKATQTIEKHPGTAGFISGGILASALWYILNERPYNNLHCDKKLIAKLKEAISTQNTIDDNNKKIIEMLNTNKANYEKKLQKKRVKLKTRKQEVALLRVQMSNIEAK